ncbi:unnamed protein product [Rotaria socialis]|uniref:Uncharacterized protein n=1 Tax=Rotaria socialis TaxID=392032 RepID=A0A819VBR3_9BILA|nr:unnamed protein product [Rotaria socialis]CAF4368334.1 unnamed protein product [Rotaria socialis]CAF4460102.1 unnamed protein product [Rotaria socialis]CAF4780524.1 unnamed protein product [Rotaria socialis]CAF4867313.1 unnamed protein product [Rotaria socialis]
MNSCFILLLLVPLVTSFHHKFKQRSTIFSQLQDLLDDDDQGFDLTSRNNDYSDINRDSQSGIFISQTCNSYYLFRTDRRLLDNGEEHYMELRATTPSNGFEITLQNRAMMNTRLRVLYTDAQGTPAIAETGRLWVGQTKSVKLPVDAKNINIIVEKDLFFENWHVAYKGTLTNENECIRIVGVTLFSKIHPCK